MSLTIKQKTFADSKPLIYLVGTPIGNRQDFSPRAQEILTTVDIILAEDTRTSQKLLANNFKKPLVAFHKFNEQQRLKNIKQWINEGKNLAIISDAGVPLISDPGAIALGKLRSELNNQFGITAVNSGPAYVHAIISSGLGTENHYFHGFLKSRTRNQKTKELSELIHLFHAKTTIVFYESVHRLLDTLTVLTELLDSHTEIAVARELTKINEEIIRGPLNEVANHLNNDYVLKGEFVILIDSQKIMKKLWDETELLKQINHFIEQGHALKQATQIVSDLSGESKNKIYQLYIDKKS